jgi:hypothetical protein
MQSEETPSRNDDDDTALHNAAVNDSKKPPRKAKKRPGGERRQLRRGILSENPSCLPPLFAPRLLILCIALCMLRQRGARTDGDGNKQTNNSHSFLFMFTRRASHALLRLDQA